MSQERRGDGRVSRMEPVSLTLTALAARTSAGSLDAREDDAKEKAEAAYEKLRSLAQADMELADPAGARSGNYVSIRDSKGFQVGNGNVQVNLSRP